MSTLFSRASAATCMLGLFTIPLSGCVAPGYGYGSDGGLGIAAAYYEPYGVDYGGWGPGYLVGPPRGGYQGAVRADHHPGAVAYRPAPASRPMPSNSVASRRR